ncbi:MAG: hypothetical protein JW820_16110 [Spirochaetales bacterium]|nr:hypothetical protein [Spirochaetales bacterium]
MSVRAEGRERLPAAVLMSGTGSNARKLLEYAPPGGGPPAYRIRLILSDNPASNFRRIAEAFGVEARLHDIYEFCGVPRPSAGEAAGESGAPAGAAPQQDRPPGAAPAEDIPPADAPSAPARDLRRGLRDPRLRRAYDLETLRILEEYGVRLVAAAGYDWVISPELCGALPIVNVHPGDLRVRDPEGRRRYVGLGWIPTAKAILQGESAVRCTTHLVTAELDGGPIARVSRPVAVDLPPGVTAGNILPPGATLGEVIRDVREGGRRFGASLIVRHSKAVQERLKEAGDWVEFPLTLHRVAELLLQGRLVVQKDGRITLDGAAVGDLFLQGEGE